jgi:hypothetical protein
MTIPLAEGAAKHAAVSGAKHAAKKKLIHKGEIAARAKKSAGDAVTNTKDTAKRGGKKAAKRFSDSKLNPKFMPAPTSYSVRKQHNILIGMWMACNFVWIFAYYNNEAAIAANPNVQPITTKLLFTRWVAINFAFFILSVLVLFDTFARVVGSFSILIFVGMVMTNQTAILEGFKTVAKGLPIPVGGNLRVSNDNGMWPKSQVLQSAPQAPLDNGTIST